ncbi:malonate--CoA ligase [Poseidonocella sedimentorum]|uniref:Malonyl-CoA/methylmalonyl-CoA synthetase n=1 Tax=Poseidonocella sedimentorum TaxID=871652 RepID=A0A1I6CQS0_9RHOB|nr:malonyl-CoA synthase [Poseidonocella sedimentorum]SFQ95473.1 malonyl-CoA/methylmalonyl-CoA synthetase [Poseidonocella sedimentorum]
MTNPLFDTLFGAHVGRSDPFLHLPDGQTLTYDAFLQTAARLARLTARLGLTPGDRVAVQVAKSPDALALYAACAQAGLVFLPLNTAYTGAELAYFIEDSGAALVVCDTRDEAALAPLCATLGARLETLGADGAGSLMTKAAEEAPRFQTAARAYSDLAALLYTSGTTGRSKGAMLTQENLLTNALTLVEAWRFTADDVLLHALPIFHTHGLFVATNITLAAGGSMIFQPRFDLDAIFAALPRATTMMGVPTFYTRMLDDPRLTRAATEHMRLFVSGSAPLLAETHAAFAQRTGQAILERYGMTETGMNSSNPYEGARRAGTVGPPLPGVEVAITEAESGAPLPQGEIGQIEVRGPNVFAGYWNMPEKTAAELRENGFFQTGDLGRIDEAGYLHIVGRSKDLIISGGLNIYPKEIETLLDAQPGIRESAVIGVPHPDFGETVVALLVPEPGATPQIDAITAAARAELARFKMPREMILVDDLPRNAMGKVQKAQLRARYADLFTG